MNNVTIDPRVLEFREELHEELTAKNQGFTSLAAKRRLKQHARNRKAEARAARRAANEARREARWR